MSTSNDYVLYRRESDERDELIACPECGWEIAEKNIAGHYRIIHTT
jgi:DNA-directed RNA polymerase subunit RPC12/RpoP